MNTHMRLRRLEYVIYLFLILATVSVFGQVRNHDFVEYDDKQYVTENRHVNAGLTSEGVIWAFTTTHASNWHPLTWLSHMLDCEIYGLDAAGHHLTSLLLHVVNTLLLFSVLKRITGALWRSAFVAALFALHPLHVESVAWVAERKDVLSTFFWMLTMWTYVRYVESPGISRYLSVLFSFALGLMAKPMLVTLPFVLLLLDYWPLGRFGMTQSDDAVISQNHKSKNTSNRREAVLRLIREKVPLLALSGYSSVITFVAQKSGEAVLPLDAIPLESRIANALVAYVSYIGKMIWPQHLAIFYPHPVSDLAIWQVAGSGLLLVCISILLVQAARRRPYLLMGWLWYLGTLVPVIGLVQVGAQSMADRYSYVPLIGLFVMIGWGVSDLVARWRIRRAVLYMSGATVLLGLIISSCLQVRHWRNQMTLFEHAALVTTNNYLAHNNLGNALAGQGKFEEAIAHYLEALRIKPNYVRPRYNLGHALARLGRFDEAIIQYSQVLQIKPDYAEAHNNRAYALHRQGKLNEAIAGYREALQIKSDFPEAHYNLGLALQRQGKVDEAIAQYSEAVRLKPDYGKAHRRLAFALRQASKRPSDLTGQRD